MAEFVHDGEGDLVSGQAVSHDRHCSSKRTTRAFNKRMYFSSGPFEPLELAPLSDGIQYDCVHSVWLSRAPGRLD